MPTKKRAIKQDSSPISQGQSLVQADKPNKFIFNAALSTAMQLCLPLLQRVVNLIQKYRILRVR
jgi:hypothetical protein